ncbi:hypothetical protein ACFOHT_05620 [Massilia oculi]|uniref:hypothetical protein n=1 Tax=Massilia oculi TaxID=945844 RepID=UPI003617E7E8
MFSFRTTRNTPPPLPTHVSPTTAGSPGAPLQGVVATSPQGGELVSASAHPARVSSMQTDFQINRNRALNAAMNDIVRCSSHMTITRTDMDNLRKAKRELMKIDHAMRMEAAGQLVGDVYKALGKDQRKVFHDLYRELGMTQLAGALNTGLGILPTAVGSALKSKAGAGAVLAWSGLAQLYQPYLGVLMFNTLYAGADFMRKTGMPGRSRPIESAKTLQQTLTALNDASDRMAEALTAAHDVAPGSAEAIAARHALTTARVAGAQAMEERMKREQFDQSFDAGQYIKSLLSGTKQVAFYLSQYVAYADNQDCKGTERAFKMQMAVTGIVLGLNVLAAVADRRREAQRIMATNLAYGDVDNKNHVRDMFRSPYTQKMWGVNDGIEKRTDATLGELARLFGVPKRALKRFDEAGGFNHQRFSLALDAPRREKLARFEAMTEGPLLAGARSNMEELTKLVHLEEVGKLHMLEDLSALGVLEALDRRHAEVAGGGAAPYAAPSADEIKRLPGIVSDDQVRRLLDGPLPAALKDRMGELRARFDALDNRRTLTAGHPRMMLGLDSEYALSDLLDQQRRDPAGALPAPQAGALLALRGKYADQAAPQALADALDIDLAQATKLCAGPMSNALRQQLHDLQDKYETRAGLRGEDLVEVDRTGMLEWADLARADAKPLSASESAVRSRLEAKSRTSTLNLDGWRGNAGMEDVAELDERRAASLTPFEHCLLQTLRVRPGAPGAVPGDAILAAARLTPVMANETAAARIHTLLSELRGHRLDKALSTWDFSNLSEPAKLSVERLLQGKRGVLGNIKDLAGMRWNMPGHVVPALVVQYARATFMAVGGSGFFFLLQAAVGLARRLNEDQFACKPGEGPNDASRTFSHVMMGVGVPFLAAALLGAWAGPQTVNASRVRREFFTRREGRPNFTEMMKANYLYSARKAVTDYAGQRWFSGPKAKARNTRLMGQVDARLKMLLDVADGPDRESSPDTRPASRAGRSPVRLHPTRTLTEQSYRTRTPDGGASRGIARQARHQVAFQRKRPVTANRTSLSKDSQRLAWGLRPDGVDSTVLATSYSHQAGTSAMRRLASNLMLDMNMYLEEKLQLALEHMIELPRMKKIVELVHQMLDGAGAASGLPLTLDDETLADPVKGDLRKARLLYLKEQLRPNYDKDVLETFFNNAEGSDKAINALRNAASKPLSPEQQLQIKLVKMLFGQKPYFGGSSEYHDKDVNSFEYWIYHLSTITRDPRRALKAGPGELGHQMLKPMRDYLTPDGSLVALNNQSNLGVGVAEADWEELSPTMHVAIKRQLQKHLDKSQATDASKLKLYTTSFALWDRIRKDYGDSSKDYSDVSKDGSDIDKLWNRLSEDDRKEVYGDIAAIPWEDAHLHGKEGMMNVAGVHGNVLQTPQEAADRYIRHMKKQMRHEHDTDVVQVPRPDGSMVSKNYVELREDFLRSHESWYRSAHANHRPIVGGMSGHTLGYLNLYKDALIHAMDKLKADPGELPSLEFMRVVMLAALVGQKRHHSYDEVMAASQGISDGRVTLEYKDRTGFRDLLESGDRQIAQIAGKVLGEAVDGYDANQSGSVLAVLTRDCNLSAEESAALSERLRPVIAGYLRSVAEGTSGEAQDGKPQAGFLDRMEEALNETFPADRGDAASVRSV